MSEREAAQRVLEGAQEDRGTDEGSGGTGKQNRSAGEQDRAAGGCVGEDERAARCQGTLGWFRSSHWVLNAR